MSMPQPYDVPPGVHPHDQGEMPHPAWEQPPGVPVTQSPEQAWQAGKAPFGQSNQHALGIFQRSAETWQVAAIVLDANQGSSAKIFGKQKGRTKVLLYTPTDLPSGGANPGVLIGPSESEVQQGTFQVGTTSGWASPLTLETEAPVWAGVIPGQSTGFVLAIAFVNPETSQPNM